MKNSKNKTFNFNHQKSIALMMVLFSGLYLLGCDGDKRSETQEIEEVVKIDVPEFNEDSAYLYVEKQVAFGPRVPNSRSHAECADYLATKLQSFGATVTRQEFEASAYDGNKLNLTNIIGAFNPHSSKRILLAAHWDTRPYADKDSVQTDQPIDGANDGASGVGVLMEIARQLQAQPLENIGVDIIFFDGEDYGIPITDDDNYPGVEASGYCLGSQYWSKNKHIANYSAFYGILLDMVGAEGAQFYQEGISMNFAPSIMRKIWKNGAQLGYGYQFVNRKSDPITDDHLFVNNLAKIPMVDIIEYDPESDDYFGAYHHRHSDNMSIIDRKSLEAVGQTLLYTIYYE